MICFITRAQAVASSSSETHSAGIQQPGTIFVHQSINDNSVTKSRFYSILGISHSPLRTKSPLLGCGDKFRQLYKKRFGTFSRYVRKATPQLSSRQPLQREREKEFLRTPQKEICLPFLSENQKMPIRVERKKKGIIVFPSLLACNPIMKESHTIKVT